MSVRLIRSIAAAAIAVSTIGLSQASAQFTTGPLYAGPHIWIGGLNGATAFGVQVEKGITSPGDAGPGIISGGVGIDYYSWSYGFYGYKYTVVPIQAFSNYHFPIESNTQLDPYVGLALVYSYRSVTYANSTYSGGLGSSLDFAGHAGLRYFVSDNLAIHGQVGFGFGTLGIGVDWKF